MGTDMAEKSFRLRLDVLEMVGRAKAGHIGGAFSVLDILLVLYGQTMNISPETVSDPDRDRFVLSKGHAAEALYAVLADGGFIQKQDLERFFVFGSDLPGHPTNEINGVEVCTGALGHGLSVGVGMALAARLDNRAYRTYVVLGDGELAEGSNWEAAMAASHYKLDNLCAVVDRNGLQISGTTENVMSLETLSERFCAFGWTVVQADGHDHAGLQRAFETAKRGKGRPCAVIAATIKGKGVSFMENTASWHHRIPTEEEYKAAVDELKRGVKEARG